MKELNKDADKLLCLLYKEYLQSLENGSKKLNAKMFGGSDYIKENIIEKWSKENIDDTCRELHRGNYIDCFYGGGSVNEFVLLDEAIIYMETRFKRGLNEVMETINLFKIW